MSIFFVYIFSVKPAQGDAFDGDWHEIVQAIPIPGKEANEILFLEKSGFKLESRSESENDQILREARVGVTA